MDRIGGPGALVNWRCNTKQWWVGAVPDSVAPSINRSATPITADNVHGVVGKDYPVEMKHVFWAHMECGLVLSGNSSRRQKGRPGGATCASIVRGTGVPGEGAPASSRSGPARPSCSWCWTSRRRASNYNRWVKERLEYYRRVEPSAPLRDVSIVDQKVPRFRFSQTTQTGHVSNAIWELILRNPEAAALKRIDDIAKGAA